MGFGFIDIPDELKEAAFKGTAIRDARGGVWSHEERRFVSVKVVRDAPLPEPEVSPASRADGFSRVRFNTKERKHGKAWAVTPMGRRAARALGRDGQRVPAYRCWMSSDDKRSLLMERSRSVLKARRRALVPVEQDEDMPPWSVACECGYVERYPRLKDAKKDTHLMGNGMGVRCRATISGGSHGVPGRVSGGRS